MKILFVNDFSELSTGYGKYGKELLTRFYRDGYEVAELALACRHNSEKIKNCPWTVYPNLPNEGEEKEYESNAQNSNGKWKFEPICLNFKPNIVISLTDPYFSDFITHSPFRQYYNWITMATVDGLPQHTQWLDFYKRADGLITYTDWGKSVLESCGLKVNGVASPASSDLFPINKDNIKHFKHNIGFGDKIVIGTIMRNQPRKLYDALFEMFSILNQNNEYILYCHTTYPDGGWDFGELLLKHNIASSVYFTYQCQSCGEVFLSNFEDMGTSCKNCGAISCVMPGGQSFVDNKMLNKIINIFDFYIQFASREGFGMPQVEAAACNIPIITIPYAGMIDSVDKLDAKPVKIKSYYLSYPMNMMEAVPDIYDAIDIIKSLKENSNISTRELYLKNYSSWDKPYEVFKNIIDNLKIKKWEIKEIKQCQEYIKPNIDNDTYAKYLLSEIYNRPDLINSYLHARLLRDLNFSVTHGGICGNYLTENLEHKNVIPFDCEMAYKVFYQQRQFDDFWQYNLNEVLKNEKNMAN